MLAGGRVVKWQVRCGSAGTVYLAMMRPKGSLTSLQLIGRHLITVTADMVNQIVVRRAMDMKMRFESMVMFLG
jgi:hypothetical protein